MRKRRDSELKERMMALKVNEPLKLKKEGFVFKPPHEESEVPRKEAPPIIHSRFEPAQIEPPQASTAKPLIPSGSSDFRNQTEVTQNEVPQKQRVSSEQPQIEVTQIQETNGNQCEAPRNDPPQNEAAQREVGGFFKLSHRVFFEPLLRDLSGDSFRLFLWLSSRAWRFPTSDGTMRASVGFIESQAGMSHATISRALKTLKDKALISVIEVDFKKGNLWQISSIACNYPSPGTDPDGRPTHKKVPQNEAPRSSSQGTSNRGGTQLKLRQPPPQNEEDLRSYKKLKKSKEVPPKNIFVPIAMETELDSVPEEAVALFEENVPSETQERIIAGYMNREFPHGFFPPARVVKTLAAKDWFRTRPNYPVSATA